MWYHVAEPNAYLVITGAGVKDVKIAKKSWLLPGQKVTKISVTPFECSMTLQAMTKEKLKFSLPAVFTVGPKEDEGLAAIKRYAVLLTGESDGAPSVTRTRETVGAGRNHVQDIVKGIIEGETRSIISNMTIEEIFASRTEYKKQVMDKVQTELDQFGLMIYNANVKELEDTPGSEYFSFMRRKAHESASSKAKVDVAFAQTQGRIGESEQTSRAKQEIAKIDATTAVLETQRKKEKALADQGLQNTEIAIEKELNIERINAARAAEIRDASLQKDVELKRAEMELERLRAKNVVQAKIARESAEQNSQAELYKQQKLADAGKYKAAADAEGAAMRQKQEADAAKYSQSQAAEAHLNAKMKEADASALTTTKAAEARFAAAKMEAEGRYLAMKAEAAGMKELAGAYQALAQPLGGPAGLMQYLMIRDGTYEKLAKENAGAIRGLNPKINVWTTGDGQGQDSLAPIKNIFQSLPPLMSTIQDQTGITPFPFLANMPGQQQQQQSTNWDAWKADADKALAKKENMVNGVGNHK